MIWEYATKFMAIINWIYVGMLLGSGLFELVWFFFFLMVGWIFLMSSFYAREKQVEKRLRYALR